MFERVGDARSARSRINKKYTQAKVEKRPPRKNIGNIYAYTYSDKGPDISAGSPLKVRADTHLGSMPMGICQEWKQSFRERIRSYARPPKSLMVICRTRIRYTKKSGTRKGWRLVRSDYEEEQE